MKNTGRRPWKVRTSDWYRDFERKKPMLFEIFNREGDRVEWTQSPKCLPSKTVFQTRLKDGYHFKLNGKAVKTYEKLEEILQGG